MVKVDETAYLVIYYTPALGKVVVKKDWRYAQLLEDPVLVEKTDTYITYRMGDGKTVSVARELHLDTDEIIVRYWMLKYPKNRQQAKRQGLRHRRTK